MKRPKKRLTKFKIGDMVAINDIQDGFDMGVIVCEDKPEDIANIDFSNEKYYRIVWINYVNREGGKHSIDSEYEVSDFRKFYLRWEKKNVK